VAEDAFKDPKTDQLESYLERAGVGALLDAPIYRDGHVTGVVCHEHVGGPREWQEREASFASTVADLLTMLIQQAERAELRAALDVRRELEAENRKMDALLRMARVVVHDLGNVLTVAAMRAEDIDARAEELGGEKVSEVLDYGVKLLEQLRDFCDRVEPESVAFAAEVLRALESTLRNLLGTSIRLDFQCKVPAGLRIAVSPVELEQLILNLCMNAKDAIGDAGTIVLSATTSAGSLFIEIRDSGCGMDDATQQHLFEPFYSTKDGHTGVGLSAVFGIVDRIGGLIHVQSARGHGSTFRVELPLLQAQPARRAV
jgi:signal transduction histidine kinase